MSFGLLNLLMLAGLAGVAIPPVIHLLNRRRYEVVDWGAMQFLQMSQRTRRKVFIEELLLMLLRMGLIALLVLALAAPFGASPLFDRLGNRDNRDVVLVIDGSTSMGYTGGGKTPHDQAKEWAARLIDGLAPGDGVAVLHAKQQVIPVLGELTTDHDRARDALGRLSPPRGGCDWPQALQAAHQLLQTSHRPRRDIILLSDGQRFGWADEETLRRWRLLAGQLAEGKQAEPPRVWAVHLDSDRPTTPPNWSLAPVQSGRALASAEIRLETALKLHGQAYQPPHRIRLEIDGQPAPDLPAPAAADLRDGQVPLRFSQTFAAAGSHLVSVIVEPDAPGHSERDQLPGDNRQDFALFVPTLPVLLIDGTPPTPGKLHAADFFKTALLGKGKNAFRVRIAPAGKFAEALGQDVGPEADTKPRVLVLCDVPQLKREEQAAVERFLGAGGGVLVTLGAQSDRLHYNQELYRQADGWLPTTLDDLAGDEKQPTPEEGKPDPAAHPLPSTFKHPALELWRDEASGLGKVRFPRWWKIMVPGQGAAATTVARLTSGDPFLVEGSFGKGRVLLCPVPLDDSWGTNLQNGTEVQEFPLLAHELVYYLAGARAVAYNLVPGQPLVYQPVQDEPLGTVVVQPPYGEAKQLTARQWPLVYDDTREPGPYRLTTPGGHTVYYVVQPDPRETDDLALSKDEDCRRVADIVPLEYVEEPGQVFASPARVRELWWWLMLGVVGLLCTEVWMTRRIAKGR